MPRAGFPGTKHSLGTKNSDGHRCSRDGGGSRSSALDQLERQFDLLGRGGGIVDATEQQASGDPAGFAKWLGDRGQSEVVGEVEVVEADHRDIVRALPSAVGDGLQHADGLHIAVGEDRGGPVGEIEQRVRLAAGFVDPEGAA